MVSVNNLSPHHTGWQLLLFVVSLGILSIPLGAALRQIAFEAVAQRQVRDTVRARFPQGSRLSQVDIDFSRTPIQVRAVMLTPATVAQADRLLAIDLQERLSRPVDIHVDQLRTSIEAGATEVAQIARAQEANRAAVGDRNEAVATLALIAGTDAVQAKIDEDSRTIGIRATELPGLGLEGYRALEMRAIQAIPGWTVEMAPSQNVALPDLTIEQGVIDGLALDLAGWVSLRLKQVLLVEGGTTAQRRAIVDGIVALGGKADIGKSTGRLSLIWQVNSPVG